MNPLGIIRAVVSGDKRRTQHGDINLDLTYITPRIIAMGIPTVGVTRIWRNSLSDVEMFLNKCHGSHVQIINVSEDSYDTTLCKMVWHGWPDHHSPNLALLLQVIEEMHQWLSQDAQNVVAVHCKAGRGRTGTVIASYLLFYQHPVPVDIKQTTTSEITSVSVATESQREPDDASVVIQLSGVETTTTTTNNIVLETADDALRYFAGRRSSAHSGVHSPSQKRYVGYIEKLLKMNLRACPPPKKLLLTNICMRPLPNMGSEPFTPSIQIINLTNGQYKPIYTTKSPTSCDKSKVEAILHVGCVVEGDILIRVYHHTVSLSMNVSFMVFRMAFHTSFIPPNNILRLERKEIDAEKSGHLKDTRFSPGFYVEIHFADSSPPVVDRSLKPNASPDHSIPENNSQSPPPPTVDRSTKPYYPPQQ